MKVVMGFWTGGLCNPSYLEVAVREWLEYGSPAGA